MEISREFSSTQTMSIKSTLEQFIALISKGPLPTNDLTLLYDYEVHKNRSGYNTALAKIDDRLRNGKRYPGGLTIWCGSTQKETIFLKFQNPVDVEDLM